MSVDKSVAAFDWNATTEPDVLWGSYGIDTAAWSDAEPSEAPGMAAPTKTRTSVPGLSLEDEAWLGHA